MHQLHNKRSQAIECGSYSDAIKLECFFNDEAVSSILRTPKAFSCDNPQLVPKLHMASWDVIYWICFNFAQIQEEIPVGISFPFWYKGWSLILPAYHWESMICKVLPNSTA